MPGDHLVFSRCVLQRSDDQGREDAVLPDALREGVHLGVVADVVRVVPERVQVLHRKHGGLAHFSIPLCL